MHPRKLVRKPTVIDLFAGCGGLSLGLEQAGFRTLAFSELNKSAAETYRINRADDPPLGYSDVSDMLVRGRLPSLLRRWKTEGIERVDLVAGGPPCQGYSAIGHRRSYAVERHELPSNHLYKQMVTVIRRVQPRIFLFENVRGIMNGRWTRDGEPGQIWRDVLKAFQSIKGYHVRWALVRAANYGVPQNRPRVLIVGFHDDIGWQPQRSVGEDADAVAAGMLPFGWKPLPSIEDALGDLEHEEIGPVLERDKRLRSELVTKKYPREPQSVFQFEMRTARHALEYEPGAVHLTQHEYSRHSSKIIEKFKKLLDCDGELPEDSPHRTRKFAQRVLPRSWHPKIGPNITVTSLPDDFVHYSQPRILTVREWARLQTFPDWYDFAGPRTTGGLRRAGKPTEGVYDREVPRYTQIGNAVPVRLAEAIGHHFRHRILSKAER
jgi:DNA (cytosine-5)-methyltransferase 1